MPIDKDELRWLRNQIEPYGGQLRGLRSNLVGAGGLEDMVPCLVDDDGLVDIVPASEAAGYGHQPPVLEFAELPGNSVHEGLAAIDSRFSPTIGLRRVGPDGRLTPVTKALGGRSLLFVHGTFSNCDNLFGQLERKQSSLLSRMFERYENVLTFDYPTLSQQAVASAITLERQTRQFVPGTIDVVSHSQGGLVVRYWLELFARERLDRTVSIFVAGTLAGTALAAPWALRRALQGLFNVGLVFKLATGIFMPMVSSVIPLLQKTTGYLAATSIADAGVALVPGFQGMSQVSTNAELLELQRTMESVPSGYFAITGDFQPEPVGWKQWKRLYSRTADAGADLLFQEPNDLVVNTAAMTHLADGKAIPQSRVLHYAAGASPVHHTNYFDQPATGDALADWLRLN